MRNSSTGCEPDSIRILRFFRFFFLLCGHRDFEILTGQLRFPEAPITGIFRIAADLDCRAAVGFVRNHVCALLSCPERVSMLFLSLSGKEISGKNSQAEGE